MDRVLIRKSGFGFCKSSGKMGLLKARWISILDRHYVWRSHDPILGPILTFVKGVYPSFLFFSFASFYLSRLFRLSLFFWVFWSSVLKFGFVVQFWGSVLRFGFEVRFLRFNFWGSILRFGFWGSILRFGFEVWFLRFGFWGLVLRFVFWGSILRFDFEVRFSSSVLRFGFWGSVLKFGFEVFDDLQYQWQT